jgi:hypothetical protein
MLDNQCHQEKLKKPLAQYLLTKRIKPGFVKYYPKLKRYY